MADGVPEHLCCERLVDLPVLSHWQAHAAEAEDGEVGVVQYTVEHGGSSLGVGTGVVGEIKVMPGWGKCYKYL